MDNSYAIQQRWKVAFFILSAFILIIMPMLSHSYGQSGDEWLQIEYGRDIWNYFVHGNPQALDYSAGNTQHLKQELYGGLYDFGTEVLHQWFPSIPQLTLRHFFNALSGAFFMIFTGLLAFRLSRKWAVGFITLLFIFFSPRIFGESMNNPKDIPFGCGFIAGVYFFIAMLQDAPRKLWRHAIGLALGFGLAFGVRAAGGALQLAYFFVFAIGYYFFDADFKARVKDPNNKLMKRIALFAGGALVVGYIIGLSCWPYGLQSPIGHPLESLAGMTNRETNVRVLFEGKYYRAHHMPWYYEFKWIFISNPLIIVLGFILFPVLTLPMSKKLGRFTVLFIVFGALFPILYMIYKNSTVYDTWRHIFFVYPFWVIAAAFGWWQLGEFFTAKMAKTNEPVKERYIWQVIAVLGLIPAIVWTVRSHPNQYVYFNEATGGAKGAYGKYDLDYYTNSGLQAGEWVLKNVKPIPGRKIFVRSNMAGFDKYWAKDTAWLASDYGRYNERHAKDWDYFIVNPRFLPIEQLQPGGFPPMNTIYTVKVDGVPLAAIIQRKSTDGIAASKALEANDLPTAVRLYESYLKTDTTDEFAYFNYGIALAQSGQVDAGVLQLQHAIRLQPSNSQFYGVLAKIYAAKGDNAHAQEAGRHAQELDAEQREIEGDGE